MENLPSALEQMIYDYLKKVKPLVTFNDATSAFQRALVRTTLEMYQYRHDLAAKELGMTRGSFLNLRKRLGMFSSNRKSKQEIIQESDSETPTTTPETEPAQTN